MWYFCSTRFQHTIHSYCSAHFLHTIVYSIDAKSDCSIIMLNVNKGFTYKKESMFLSQSFKRHALDQYTCQRILPHYHHLAIAYRRVLSVLFLSRTSLESQRVTHIPPSPTGFSASRTKQSTARTTSASSLTSGYSSRPLVSKQSTGQHGQNVTWLGSDGMETAAMTCKLDMKKSPVTKGRVHKQVMYVDV